MSIWRNQYPAPVPTGNAGGQLHAMRNFTGYLRQPDLKQAPGVVAVTGLGTGSGAGIQNEGSDADQSQGLIILRVGINPSGSGTCPIRFPIAPGAGQYRIMADWATLTPTVSVNQLLIAWTANRPLIPGEELTIAYQWTNST